MSLAKSQDTKSTHKNQLHFYTPITTMQKSKFQNTILLKIPFKNMKCLGINLTKQVQDLYGEYYKMMIKINQRDLYKWREIVSWIGRLNIVMMPILPN